MPVCEDCGNTSIFGAERAVAADAIQVLQFTCDEHGIVSSQAISIDRLKTRLTFGSTQFYCWACTSVNVTWMKAPLVWGDSQYAPETEDGKGTWFRQVHNAPSQDGSGRQISPG